MRPPKALRALDRRPWLGATLAAVGITSLIASVFALAAPPELLDEAWLLGDRKLVLVLLGLFAFSLIVARLSWRTPKAIEIEEEEPPPPPRRSAEGHLR
jgi:hypothetical protein